MPHHDGIVALVVFAGILRVAQKQRQIGGSGVFRLRLSQHRFGQIQPRDAEAERQQHRRDLAGAEGELQHVGDVLRTVTQWTGPLLALTGVRSRVAYVGSRSSAEIRKIGVAASLEPASQAAGLLPTTCHRIILLSPGCLAEFLLPGSVPLPTAAPTPQQSSHSVPDLWTARPPARCLAKAAWRSARNE